MSLNTISATEIGLFRMIELFFLKIFNRILFFTFYIEESKIRYFTQQFAVYSKRLNSIRFKENQTGSDPFYNQR